MDILTHLKEFIDYPCHLYLKNSNGQYLECNHHLAVSAGYKKTSDLIGLTDHDLLPLHMANQITYNDQIVLTTQSFRICVENAGFRNNHISDNHHYLSYKFPHYTREGNLIGLMGITFALDNYPSIHIDPSVSLFIQPKFPSKNHLIQKLSAQQKICLEHVLLGKTSKEIGTLMGLSSRTIEQYIDIIKTKFSCKHKRDLIALFQTKISL